jgi:hypothetical protein
MASVSLNSQTFYPADIELNIVRKGTAIEPADGSERFALRAVKRQWKLRWKTILDAEREDLEAIASLTTSFTYVDERGTSYTVIPDPQPLRSNVAIIAKGAVLYYAVELNIRET